MFQEKSLIESIFCQIDYKFIAQDLGKPDSGD